jgi:hypothetical protein
MQQSLTRIVGTHMTLLGLLSTSIMPSAAFAAVDTEVANITVNVDSVMVLTVTSPADFNFVYPGGAQQKAHANMTVATNGYLGYNISAVGSNSGTGACDTEVLCSVESGLTTIPIADAATRYSGSNAAVGTGNESGLVFRIRSTATGAGDNVVRWGTDSPGTELFAAFPINTAQTILNQDSNASGSMITAYTLPVTYGIKVPATQMEGGYAGVITYTATSN